MSKIVFYSILGGIGLYCLGWFTELVSQETVYIEEAPVNSEVQTYPYKEEL